MDCDAYADAGLAALSRLASLSGVPVLSCRCAVLPGLQSGVVVPFGGHSTEELSVNVTLRAVDGQLVDPMNLAETSVVQSFRDPCNRAP